MDKKDVKFEMSTGMAHKLAMAFGRNGWSLADVDKLCEGSNLAKLLVVIDGWYGSTPKQFPSSSVAAPFIAEFERQSGIKLQIIHEDRNPTDFQVKDMEPINPLGGKNDDFVGINTIMQRAKMPFKANHILADAVRMLERQSEIPLAFLQGTTVFTGTLLFDMATGNEYIPLLWLVGSGAWKLDFLRITGEPRVILGSIRLPFHNKK